MIRALLVTVCLAVFPIHESSLIKASWPAINYGVDQALADPDYSIYDISNGQNYTHYKDTILNKLPDNRAPGLLYQKRNQNCNNSFRITTVLKISISRRYYSIYRTIYPILSKNGPPNNHSHYNHITPNPHTYFLTEL
nr:snake venom metalloproteinases P-III precursor [Rhamphiophis oxyrhynchus]